MKVKVFLMLDIDEEENILPVDEDTEFNTAPIVEITPKIKNPVRPASPPCPAEHPEMGFSTPLAT